MSRVVSGVLFEEDALAAQVAREKQVAEADRDFFTDESNVAAHTNLAFLLARLTMRHGIKIGTGRLWDAWRRTTDWLPVTQTAQKDRLGITNDALRFRVIATHIPEYQPDQSHYSYARGGTRFVRPLVKTEDHISSFEKIRIRNGMRRDSDQRIVEGTDLAVICSNGYVSNSNSRICDRSYIEKPYGPFQRFMGLALPEYDDTGLSLRPQYLHASSESFQLVESLAHALMQEAIVQSAALEA